jgi:branched-chain amino acid transport system substrate-binding protein
MVAAVAVAAVVAAFASTGAAGARVGSDARGVTSDSIKVAGLTDGQQPEAADGAKVVFDAANDAGGVNGRKFDYQGGNSDKGDATQNQTIAKRLVQQDQVFAVVPTVTPNLGSSGTFFQQQKVPFFGWGIATGFCNNPYAFGFTGCIVPPPPVKTAGNTWGALLNTLFKNNGDGGAKGKTAAVIAEDGDSGRTGVKVIAASAKSVNMKVTYEKASVPGPPATVADFSPYVQDIMTSNNGKAPDAVFLVVAFTNVLGLAKGLTDAGYKGIITNAVAYDPRLVATAKGQTVFTQFSVPESASTNPEMQKVVDTIKKYAPEAAVTQGFLAGYFSADFFVKAVKAAGKNLTPESLAKAAGKMTYEIKGVVGPTKYPAGVTQGTPCGALTQSNGTAYEVAVPYACYSNITLKGLKPIPYK